MTCPLRIYEQADMTRGELPVYSWILDGKGVRFLRKALPLWKWLRCPGGRGCLVTNDKADAARVAINLGIVIQSNGTHDRLGVHACLVGPMHTAIAAGQ